MDGQNWIRKIILRCVICFRLKPKFAVYEMENSPSARVNKTRPFNCVGIDYCGLSYIGTFIQVKKRYFYLTPLLSEQIRQKVPKIYKKNFFYENWYPGVFGVSDYKFDVLI